MVEKKKKSYPLCLMWLCWLIYAVSYMGKVNFGPNVAQIMAFYNVGEAEYGLVGTFFFIAYGAGQIFNGIFCKKYNLKWVIFGSLTISGTINFIIPFLPVNAFSAVKFLWLLNGASMSVLWPSLIRLLSEHLSKRNMAKASVIIGTTVATGTFAIYGLSAIYSTFNFKFAFYTPGIALPLVAIIWIAFAPNLMKKAKAIAEEEDSEGIPLSNPVATQAQKSVGTERKLLFLSIFTLMAYAVFTNLIKDGLTTWVPKIFKDTFGLPDALSIIFTLALPMVTVFGNMFAVKLHKKVPDFVTQCAIQFFVAGGLILLVILSVQFSVLPLTVVGFAFACFFAGACNSIITSIFPLFMKGKVNSGLIAGILNGFCYVGSAVSQYGLGSLREALGSWNAVLWLLAIVCAVAIVVCITYHFIRLGIKKKKAQQ